MAGAMLKTERIAFSFFCRAPTREQIHTTTKFIFGFSIWLHNYISEQIRSKFWFLLQDYLLLH